MNLTSQVIITSQLENTIYALEKLRKDEQIIEILPPSMAETLIKGKEEELRDPNIHRIVCEKESFRLTDAKTVVEKAYMASEKETVIVLVATIFSTEVQNKLLKILEEPPKNKSFLILTESKSAILPTIKSRLPVNIMSEKREETALDLDLTQLSLSTVYEFIQTHKRTDTKAMKLIIEAISKEAIRSQKYDLDEKTLKLFSNAFIALDVGSPPQFVVNALLLKLLARKKR